jgi:PHD/YefM family antitoxin component YafN of YafNO toxin-antitoxin module
MTPQVLIDDKGNETGVFIPMEDWRLIKARLGETEKDFILTPEHLKILDKASAEPIENCIDGTAFIKNRKEKHAL